MGRKARLEELVDELAARLGGRYKAILSVYSRVAEGRLRLIDPNPPRSLPEYLARLDYSLWFWSALLVTLAATILALTNASTPLVKPLRYMVSGVYLFYLPGYLLVETLYPEEDRLKPIERLALSLGLSLAIVPLVALLLNYTPPGLRLESVVAAFDAYNTAMALTAAYRKLGCVKLAALRVEAGAQH